MAWHDKGRRGIGKAAVRWPGPVFGGRCARGRGLSVVGVFLLVWCDSMGWAGLGLGLAWGGGERGGYLLG